MNASMALRSLVSHPGRSALTLIGIVIGIVALVVMMSLTDALLEEVQAATQPLGAGVFQVQKEPRWITRRLTGVDGRRRAAFSLEDVDDLQDRLTRTKRVGGEMWSWGNRARTAERATDPVCGLVGAMSAFPEANGIDLSAGRFISDQDVAMQRAVIVIGSDIVERLFPGGDDEAIGSRIRVKGRQYEVIGTMAERPTLFGARWRNAILAIPITTFYRRYGFRSLHITMIPNDPDKIDRAMEEAVVTLRSMRGVPPGEPNDFEIFNNESLGAYIDQLAIVIGSATAAICALALLVGGIGVMNIMLVSVTERTREIGIRKALGARPSTILGQFITEAVALTGFGGLVGIGLAAAGVRAAAQILELPAAVPLWAVAVAFFSSTLIGLIAGIYPAARAAKLHPIDALRYE